MCRIFDVSNAYKKKKNAVERIGSGGVGGTGTGSRDGALVAGEGWGGRRGWMAVPRLGWLFKRVEGKPLGPRPLDPRLGLGEGSKGFGCGGVGGRGTAPELGWWTGSSKKGGGLGLGSKEWQG